MNTCIRIIRNILFGAALAFPSAGYSVDFSQRPLASGSDVKNNVMFILDDSGSMNREYMPDGIANDYAERVCVSSFLGICLDYGPEDHDSGLDVPNFWYYSSVENTVFFNPETQYQPPYKADGSGRYPASDFSAAKRDGYNGTVTDNLNEEFNHRNLEFEEAFFYRYDESNGGCDGSDSEDNDCYTYVGASDFSAEVRQNYANWYSYYRTRLFASRAGIAEAFYSLEDTFRLGWGQINSGEGTVDDASGIRAVVQGVRDYTSDYRESFLNYLYAAAPASNGAMTPLRRALQGAGKYYETSARAWTDDPAQSFDDQTNPELECRLSYTILMTDGFWNGSSPSLGDTSNVDGSDGSQITGPGGQSYTYTARSPFSDTYGNTLADVAMYYWNRDLRPDLDNFVPRSEVKAVPVGDGETPYVSPAFWQHMITYGVGLGLPTQQDKNAAFSSLRSEAAISWPQPSSGSINNIDDLLHAGVNGHGGFFSAADPQTFSSELRQVLEEATSSPSSATSAEVTGEVIQEGELIFSAAYDPSGWTGDLRAAELGYGGSLVPDFDEAIAAGSGWSAASWLDSDSMDPSTRTIITYADQSGTPLRWNDGLSNLQQQDLNYGGEADGALGQDRLSYLRGDQSNEGTGRDFRRRSSLLGTIVNSSPNVVGAPMSGWPDRAPFGTDSSRYSDYYDTNEDRTPVVYVGSNDGMLHGFDATLASAGEEVLAYIPGFLFSDQANRGLHYLTNPNYSHRYYVDLPTRKQDVYTKGRRANGNPTSSSEWRTVLLGGARAGGKGIFALDVSDPNSFSESNATQLALWEFTADDDSRLGHITEPPVVAMSRWDGQERWSAFVSNGYNSETQSTGFFVLDFEGGLDGSWDGDYQYVEFSNAGDGLSPITVLDTTGDYMADRVYAGDLDGNIWVAEVNGDGDWTSSYAGPLFTAGEPVTGAVAVGANKEQPQAGNMPNLMVYFGTGKYLESDDLEPGDTKSFYGVWDKGQYNLTEQDLVPRTFSEETRDVDGTPTLIRVGEGEALNFGTDYGWYADLPTSGERVVNNPIVRGDYVYINTIIPSMDPCLGGGDGWIMAFGRMNGLVVDNSNAFVSKPNDTQGFKTKGMPSQIVIRGDTLMYDESGENNPPKLEDLPPISSGAPGAGRRGWVELVE